MVRDAGSVAIIGAGLAGFTAATTMRSLGHEGTITLIDGEPGSYDRPPLSKSLFDEDFSLERLSFASAADLAAKGIETCFGTRVTGLDADTGEISFADGSTLSADTILLATGGEARTLPIPGIDLPGVSVLRTYLDALALREAVTSGTRVAVVGAGLIGAELASALRERAAEVWLIDPAETPLVPAVGALLARHLHGMHEAHGVHVVTDLTSEFVDTGDALLVRVQEGQAIEVDRIVVGVGLLPSVALAESAGLEIDNGIIVDELFRTSSPRVYAAGDVARLRDREGALHRREEHWEAAQLSGKEAAAAILGQEFSERGCSWFWSDRHGCHLEAVGRLTGEGEVVVREGAHPAVFLIEDGFLSGAAAIDDNQLVRAARRIIDQRIPVSAEDLADPAVALRSLLKAKR